ncbi:DNA repair protein RecN [Pseudooceanicola sp.]|uniref:DNA repair protein RecN n=1 Tax=Pseudooceanicola sp. TaxID=1914328 RepID=UPI0026389EE8|nr:DNA repair protein RecN [Pseudooceanicola sp.]MDF1854374.1 DNA repair protein RecN [Pseudooceanicola sp.]
MLRGLEIRNMLIIDRLDLGFQPGLNVLTGETGAGKSILLDSLGFVLGWRGRADLVRQGQAQGEVSAWFDIGADHPARAVLEAAGLPVADELILRRINTADGRKTAWINDRRASGEVLRALSDTLVELHGQHDDRGLLNPRGHRALLDAFADHDGLRGEVRAAWRVARQADTALAEARAVMAELASEEDFLRHAVAELEALAPMPGEEASLDARRRQMQAAERQRSDIARAASALGRDGAEGPLNDALRWLEGASDAVDGRLDDAIAALGRALGELGEAADGVERCLDALDFDPLELERVEERLFTMRGLGRKHGVAVDELADLTARLATRLATLDNGARDIAGLEQAAAAARAGFDAVAGRLSALRQSAAQRLDQAVAAELAPLKMERARFETRLSAAEPGPEGRDEVNFTVATNPGAPAGPLARIASGGELSRFLLALKVCLTGGGRDMTLIFDEIDRGVGGATADAVGRRLRALADEGQVLVVTHSPQVAAQATHHWRVEKRVSGDQTFSNVLALDLDARVDEIAWMLSGDSITEEARAAARSLMG